VLGVFIPAPDEGAARYLVG